jgi:predicted GNAT family acetyltransferase
MSVEVRDNPDELRYELLVDGDLAGEIRYTRDGDTRTLVHTEVDPAYEGRGLATELVRETLADIRARGLRLVVICPFVADYIRRHPDVSGTPGPR